MSLRTLFPLGLLIACSAPAQSPLDALEDKIIDLYFDTLARSAERVILRDPLLPLVQLPHIGSDPRGEAIDHPGDAALLEAAWRDSTRAVRAFALRPGVERLRPDDEERPYDKDLTFVSFSRVTFSPDLTSAFFYADMVCGGLCGAGYLFLIERVNGRWRTKWSRMVWIS